MKPARLIHAASVRPPRPLLLLLGLAGSVALSACSTTPIKQSAVDLFQNVKVMARKKGERQLADGPAVAADLGCGKRGSAAARFETSEVLPERPRPGREINHRLVYAACPGAGEGVLGTLVRRLTADGRTVFEDTETTALKPGRWKLDVFIGIPAQAQPGAYRLEVRYERKGLALALGSDFTIVAP